MSVDVRSEYSTEELRTGVLNYPVLGLSFSSGTLCFQRELSIDSTVWQRYGGLFDGDVVLPLLSVDTVGIVSGFFSDVCVSLCDTGGGVFFASSSKVSSLFDSLVWPFDVPLLPNAVLRGVGSASRGALMVHVADSALVLFWLYQSGAPLHKLPIRYRYIADRVYGPVSMQAEGDSSMWLFSSGEQPLRFVWSTQGDIRMDESAAVLPRIGGALFFTAILAGERTFFTLDAQGVLSVLFSTNAGMEMSLTPCDTISLLANESIPLFYCVHSVADHAYLFVADGLAHYSFLKLFKEADVTYPKDTVSRCSVGFELVEGFTDTVSYVPFQSYVVGDSAQQWLLTNAFVSKRHALEGDYSLLFNVSDQDASRCVAEQLFCVSAVDHLVFKGFSTSRFDTWLEVSYAATDSGGFVSDTMVRLSSVACQFQLPLDSTFSQVRLRFSLYADTLESEPVWAGIDGLHFMGFLENRVLAVPQMTKREDSLYYYPVEVELTHALSDAFLFYKRGVEEVATLFNSELYDCPFVVEGNEVIQWFAYAPGYAASLVCVDTFRFGSVDTLYRLSDALRVPLDSGLGYYRLSFEMPVVYSDSMRIYIDDGESALRLIGANGAFYEKGDVLEEVVGEAHFSYDGQVYYEPKWVSGFYESDVVPPRELTLGLLTYDYLHRFICIRGLSLKGSVTFDRYNYGVGVSMAYDAQGDSALLRNYFGQLDGYYSSLFRYDVIGIVGDYGNVLSLYILALIPQLNDAVAPMELNCLEVRSGVLHLSCEVLGAVCFYTIDGRLLWRAPDGQRVFDLSAYRSLGVLLVGLDGHWFKVSL